MTARLGATIARTLVAALTLGACAHTQHAPDHRPKLDKPKQDPKAPCRQ